MRFSTLAARLRHARKAKQLTQVQLSALSGVRQSDISKIERGDTLRTTSGVELATALDVSPVWLITGDGEMQQSSSSIPHLGDEMENTVTNPEHRSNVLLVGLNKRVPRLAWHEVQPYCRKMFTPAEDRYEVVASPDATPRCFLVEIDGDAMVSTSAAESIPRGALLLCDPDQEARPGQVVVALHPRTSEPVVRQLVADGGLLYLRAYNTAYPMLEIAGHDAVIARAVEVITRRAL